MSLNTKLCYYFDYFFTKCGQLQLNELFFFCRLYPMIDIEELSFNLLEGSTPSFID